MRNVVGIAVLMALGLVLSRSAHAADIDATPANYTTQLALVGPGDTLHLSAGTYTHQLYVTNMNGTANAWITIEGPASGAPAIFTADPAPCCNTINIKDSSFVALRYITVDGMHVDGAFGVSAGGASNVVHDITIEGCTFVNHDGSQQHDAISTKTPTWNWIIRGNHISNAGTGVYLGNSDGTDPFVAGLIEYNFIEDTIGYNIEIKHQVTWPADAGLPITPTSTIIRYNVFSKNDRASPDGDRPNLLVDGFPDTGPGSSNFYQIYGNFFDYNPREALFQASGRLTVHDNIWVTSGPIAVRLTTHNTPLKLAHFYNNTVYATNAGLSVAVAASDSSVVIGNLIFSASPISGTIDVNQDNIVDALAAAGNYVNAPSFDATTMDFYPLPGKAEGTALDVSDLTSEIAYDQDFNGASKGSFTFRGAYAGSGTNPGEHLALAIRGSVNGIEMPPPGPDAGPTGGDADSNPPAGDSSAQGGGDVDSTAANVPSAAGRQGPAASDNPTGSVVGGCMSVAPSAVSNAAWIAALAFMRRRRRPR